MQAQRLLTLGFTVTMIGACQKEPAPPPPGAAKQAAKPGFEGLRDFEVVSGKLAVKARGGEVWAGGTRINPAAWDTAKHDDGLVELTVKDKTGKEIDRARVVVLNKGAEVFFKNGSSGKVEVPPTGYQHQHLRYHWDMTEGARTVLAVLTWDQPGFDLELALGQGTCPHHGTQAGAKRSTTSPVTVTHRAPEGQTLATGQWFAHVRLMNPQDAVGKETPFAIRAYVMR